MSNDYYIAHGFEWKNHKYLAKIGNRYIYTMDELRAAKAGASKKVRNVVDSLSGNKAKREYERAIRREATAKRKYNEEAQKGNIVEDSFGTTLFTNHAQRVNDRARQRSEETYQKRKKYENSPVGKLDAANKWVVKKTKQAESAMNAAGKRASAMANNAENWASDRADDLKRAGRKADRKARRMANDLKKTGRRTKKKAGEMMDSTEEWIANKTKQAKNAFHTGPLAKFKQLRDKVRGVNITSGSKTENNNSNNRKPVRRRTETDVTPTMTTTNGSVNLITINQKKDKDKYRRRIGNAYGRRRKKS